MHLNVFHISPCFWDTKKTCSHIYAPSRGSKTFVRPPFDDEKDAHQLLLRWKSVLVFFLLNVKLTDYIQLKMLAVQM